MNARVLLILSVALNCVLAVAYTLKPAATHSTPEPVSNVVGTPSPTPAVKEKKVVVTSVVTNQSIKTINWQAVESEDYKKYIANLRGIGCPEKTIRDIITADVNELFEARRKALSGNTNKFEYWKGGANMFAQMADPDRVAKNQALAKEKRALLTELLGSAPEEKMDMSAMMGGINPFEQMLDFLPTSKQTQVLEVIQSLQAKAMKKMSGGAPDAEDMKEIQKIKREGEAELAKILTPQEKEEYDMRMSETSMMLRFQMTSFQPTEQEFRALVKAKKPMDDEFGAYGGAGEDKADRDKREAAKKDMEQKLKDTLGPERYVDYQRSQDYEFQALYRIADKQGLPSDAAAKAYDMTKIAEDQAKAIRADKSLSNDQRQAALQDIRTATEKSLTETLGDKAYNNYMKQGGWRVKNIAPTPTKPAP